MVSGDDDMQVFLGAVQTFFVHKLYKQSEFTVQVNPTAPLVLLDAKHGMLASPTTPLYPDRQEPQVFAVSRQ